jgi:hypothetical protein
MSRTPTNPATIPGPSFRVVRLIGLIGLLLWGVPASAQAIPRCDPAAPLANGGPSTSPDGRFTVWIECYAPGEAAYTVYAHDAQTDTSYTLGDVRDPRRGVTGDRINFVYVGRWLPDDHVEIRAETGGGTYNWRFVFLADAAEAGSVKRIAADYVASPRFADDPPRYEWVTENGLSQTVTVHLYDVQSAQRETLYRGPCLLRDDLANALSCHMMTAVTNATYTQNNNPTRLLLTVGDSARESKTVEVRDLPDGDLLYTAETLGSGYGLWLAADTAAVFNLTFDFEKAGFGGVFVQFAEDGTIIQTQAFVLPSGADLTETPVWMEDQ